MPKDYIDFYDMFDGGGPGQMGDRFAGGGILSMLANEFFTPYGSEDDERKRRLLEMRGLFDALEAETSPGGAGGGTGSGTGVRPQARPEPVPNRMQRINEIPTSGPNPAAAAEVARLQEAQRMMGINEIPTPPPSPVADMPAGQFMDLLRSGGAQPEPVPFGGYDAPGDEYRRGFEQMIKQLGAERVRQMPQDQLMQMLQLYGHGGPMR